MKIQGDFGIIDISVIKDNFCSLITILWKQKIYYMHADP